MDAPDGQVPAPRRPAVPRRRPDAATALPFALPDEDAPRVADLSALLADIDALRLTLQTDLSLAAAALEEGAQDLAAELVDGDLFEVRAFAGRAAERLARLEEQPVDELPALVPVRRRRILSAAPLMAAAAALVGFVAFSPGRTAPAPETSLTSAAMAGIELSRLASEGAPDEQLRLAAMELNDELAVLIAKAADDPVAAQQALMLLEQTSEVLASQGDSGVLRGVMAETRALRERLREALPSVAKRPARPAVRQVLPVLPRVQEPQQEKERSTGSSAPKSSPKPAPASPKPSPSPTSAPTAAPEPPPADEPAPQSSPQPNGPLPTDEDVPGV